MTDQEMRIAIADACGWGAEKQTAWMAKVAKRFYERHGERLLDPPDYPNDLNAMHKAVMAQTQELRMKINNALMNLINPSAPYCLDRTINATAHQRAEAFLRTIGKWKE